MAQRTNPITTLNDPIPGSRAEELLDVLQHNKSRLIIKEVVEEYVGSSIFAQRIKEIVIEHTESVPFMEKTQGYADQQIDKRLFKNAKVILGLIVSWLASIGIAILITKLTSHH